MQASDNRVAGVEASQAIEGAAVYVSNILANLQTPNTLPSPVNFRTEGVKVGNARFWLIGRDTNVYQTTMTPEHPFWGLVDEATKLNLNTASAAQLAWLPQMTADLASNIYDWRTSDSNSSQLYSVLQPPYNSKGTNFETVDELRLVYGMNLDILYGEDGNLNGFLDPNEDDGDVLPPHDNKDGHLDSGLLEYCTVWTHEGNVGSNGVARVIVTNITAVASLFTNVGVPSFTQYLKPFLATATSGVGRNTTQVTTTTPPPPTCILDFYNTASGAGMSEADFQQVEPYLMNPETNGLIDIDNVSPTVLAAVINDTNAAATLINYRQSTPPLTPSISWVKDALGSNPTALTEVGPHITPYTFQYTADVAAVGHNGRGYRRVKFIFDCSRGVPQIVYRQDLTHLGWALGKKLYDQLASNTK
jgi:type II secretory pathway component PulK